MSHFLYRATLLLFMIMMINCTLSSPKPELPVFVKEAPLALSVLDEEGEISLYEYNFVAEKGESLFSKSLDIVRNLNAKEGSSLTYTYTLTANRDLNISINQTWQITNSSFATANFLLPGFWYKRNLRSPETAPSFKTSDSWSFREDRLSIPLAGAFDSANKQFVTLERADSLLLENTPDSTGGIVRTKTSIGSLGMGKSGADGVQLNASFPFEESPKSYQSKLKLNPHWKAFYPIKKGETIRLNWKLTHGQANNFSAFVSGIWERSYDQYKPQAVEPVKTDLEIKEILSNYFYESYAETKDLKGFSGLWFNTKTCETTGVLSVGFCGKVFANAYNLLEFGYEQNNEKHIAHARKVLESYFKNGFTETALLRELVYGENAEDVYTLRKQSEGIKNLLFILEFEKRKGNLFPKVEAQLIALLNRLSGMQAHDGSFPRKFDINYRTVDPSKGSTQSIITPMILASYYFNDPAYMQAAQKAGEYTEKNIIDKADYFSSTLDANCEDKEAAAIAAASFYHLARTSGGEQKEHYTELAKKAAYFGLSWYYLYDVPFADGSLLSKAKLKTRGWGNVSTENNHIDVWAFDFPHVLNWLSRETDEPRFEEMSKVIISSLKDQMLPYEGHMVGVGKKGYMPEIIQHTVWDYGANGKGYLNAHMSVGWTVASIWELLSPGRFEGFIDRTGAKSKL